MGPIKIEMPKEMFTPSEFRHYEEEAKLDFLKVGPDLYEFTEPIKWEADITNTGGAFLVTGTVEGTASTSCARCLEKVDIPVIGEIEGYFLITGDSEIPDDMAEDEFEYLPADKKIDMAPLIQAALVLEMPQIPLCDEECKGLCPKCGVNLNEGECECDRDEEPSTDNPFAMLKDFDFGE